MLFGVAYPKQLPKQLLQTATPNSIQRYSKQHASCGMYVWPQTNINSSYWLFIYKSPAVGRKLCAYVPRLTSLGRLGSQWPTPQQTEEIQCKVSKVEQSIVWALGSSRWPQLIGDLSLIIFGENDHIRLCIRDTRSSACLLISGLLHAQLSIPSSLESLNIGLWHPNQ